MVSIKVKYINCEPYIKKIAEGDWIDLCASRNIELFPNDFQMIPLGVAMELPEGYEAHVLPRSSTFKKWKILMVNSMGIIDNSYCGDNDQWHFPALCLSKKPVHIEKGDRICQFRIVKNQEHIEFVTCESLGNEDRGGFGSTGSK